MILNMSGAEEATEYDVTIFKCPNCGGEITSTDETVAGLFAVIADHLQFLNARLSKRAKSLN